ncbi:hypothetical protein ACIREE_21530 [Streptomyces sp. NPDC102467]|uniref:hypothetical protein n=1 Tax=Streptomyces sp. NPDC102467 TaxID=3366179 RepID=UPI0037F93307
MNTLVEILAKVLFFGFVVGMFALVITMFVRTNRANRRTSEGRAQLAGFARERGWTYERRTYGQIDQYCGVGPLPGRGSNLRTWHYMTGEFRGRSFKCFEYHYTDPLSPTTQTGQRQITVATVFVVTAPGAGPDLELRRAGRMDGFFDARAKMELGVPEFDEKFRVVVADESFARQVLSADLVPFLLAAPQAKESPLQLRDDELFTWYTGALSPKVIQEKLTYTCDVLDRVPAHAWSSDPRSSAAPAAADAAPKPGLWKGQSLGTKLVLVIAGIGFLGGAVGAPIALLLSNLG